MTSLCNGKRKLTYDLLKEDVNKLKVGWLDNEFELQKHTQLVN